MMRTRSLSTRVAVVLAATAATLVSVAGPALASDVVIRELAAVCAEDGSDGIAFAVTTDRTGEAAEHPAIQVEWKPAGHDHDAYAVLGTGELSADNGYTYSDTVTGLDFGDAAMVTVRATALKAAAGGGPWGDGRPAGDTYTKTISVEDCGDGSDGDARINFTAGCTTTAGEPGVILFNDGTPGEDDPLDFAIEAGVDGHTLTTSRTVAPGESTTVLLTFTDGDGAPVDTEDTSIEVAVTVGDEVHERSIEVDCHDEEGPSPDAAAEGACSEGSGGGVAVVGLHNPAATAVTFVVTIDGEVVDTVELAAGNDDTRTFVVADGDHLVTVEADGAEVADATITIDCAPAVPPTASAELVCDTAGGRVVATVDTPGEAVTAQLSVDGAVRDEVTVGAGEVGQLTAPGLADGTYAVAITAAGQTLFADTLAVDCVDVRGATDSNDPAVGGDTDTAPDAPVLEDPVVAGEQLPATGGDTVVWVLLALLLLFLGGDLVLTQLHDRWRRVSG